jgi:hypothetical protein
MKKSLIFPLRLRRHTTVRELNVWYHDASEADPECSWVANSVFLKNCDMASFDKCPYSRVLALAEYAQPDIVLSYKGVPFLSMELTRMNPSGHNLPQRFSCLVRAAETGVPSIFYYPEFARRSNSDPNPRYLNIRVPLAQMRLSEIYKVPSLSVFWPTNTCTLLPDSGPHTHSELAQVVDDIVNEFVKSQNVLELQTPLIHAYFGKMLSVIKKYATDRNYPHNASLRKYIADGDSFTTKILGKSIDPPESSEIIETAYLLRTLFKTLGRKMTNNRKISLLLGRPLSLIYTGTPNKTKDGPEHPYPGYLTLLDILYLRSKGGQTTRDRVMNLVFRLPIKFNVFRSKALDRPTGLNILMEFADLIILHDAVVVGGFIRNLSAGAVLIHD